VDALSTGSPENVSRLRSDPDFEYVEHDVTAHIDVAGELEEVYHFASPASPVDFSRIPIAILKVGSLGTHNALGLARLKGACFVLASTSEVYGDPLVHPQHEEGPPGQRQPDRHPRRLRRVQALRRSHHHDLPPPP
jgi:dTDP-glucose 4,6-dehydratase